MNQPGSNTHFRLDGKVAVVTGAGSGIGRAVALKFAAHGAAVRVLDLNLGDAEDACKEIAAAKGNAEAYLCDITNQIQVKEIFAKVASQGPLSILVNNAGISHIGTVESTTEADFDRIVRVNVKGVYNCTQAAVAHMKANGGGVILNMASIAGMLGLSDRFAYSMSKGAVISMTYSVARDCLAYKIRCNCISPARVHTPFVDNYLGKTYPGREAEMFEKLSQTQPIGRMAEPHEVAALAVYLCSDEASFITGSNYPIDGGFLNLHG